MRRETVCFSWNSDMLMVVIMRSPPNIRSAMVSAVSVLPTPDGPTRRNTPWGVFCGLRPARAARSSFAMVWMP